MVVFTCNECSEVLKRNQVDKHCQRCRRCESLSCVDCGKDFWGDDYQNHTKCITEDEKYGGKDKAPKAFKGEAKQEQWVEQVQAAIEKTSSRPKLKWLLERLRDYPNIPRKKVKFENFVKNSLRVNSPSLVTEVWDVLMTGNKTPDGSKNGMSDPNSKNDLESAPVMKENKNDTDSLELENDTVDSSVPKNKREKKEERRKKAHKKEKKDKDEEETVENNDVSEVSKKSKKRKRHELEEVQELNIENGDNKETGKLIKRKKKNTDISVELINTDGVDINNDSRLEDTEDVEEAPPSKRKKTKFSWEQVIKSVLEKKGEMTLKKLKKKVLSEFAAQDAANYSDENLSAKFDKKILKTAGVKVAKDRATLKTK